MLSEFEFLFAYKCRCVHDFAIQFLLQYPLLPTQSNLLLQMLVAMTEVDSVTQHFCSPPLSVRVAAAVRYCNLYLGSRIHQIHIPGLPCISTSPLVVI